VSADVGRVRRRLLWLTVVAAASILCGLAAGVLALLRPGSARDLYYHPSGVETLVFSPSGELVASGGGDKLVRLWTTEGFLAETIEAPDTVHALAFSDDGELLAIACWDYRTQRSSLRIWSIHERRAVSDIPSSGYGVIMTDVAFAPGGRLLAVATNAGTVELCEPRGRPLLRTLAVSGLATLSFSRSGERLAVAGGRGGKTQIFDVATGRLVQDLGLWTECAAFGPDDDQLAAAWFDGGSRGGVRLLSAKDGSVIRQLSSSVTWSPPSFDADRKRIAIAGVEGLEVRDVRDGALLGSWPMPTLAWPTRVAFSPIEDLIAFGCSDGTVRFLRVERGKK
jgi:WD40 repeat protein